MKPLSRLLLVIVVGVAIGASVAIAYGVGYDQCRNAAWNYVKESIRRDDIRTAWIGQYQYSFPLNHCWISIVTPDYPMREIQLY